MMNVKKAQRFWRATRQETAGQRGSRITIGPLRQPIREEKEEDRSESHAMDHKHDRTQDQTQPGRECVNLKERQEQPGCEDEDHRGREEDDLIQQEVAAVRQQHGPGIDREHAGPRGQIVAVAPEVIDRLGLLLHDATSRLSARRIGLLGFLFNFRRAEPATHRPGLLRTPGLELRLDVLDVVLPVNPGREPSPEIASTRDRREIVEGPEEAGIREPLQDPQVERRASDAPAGESQADQVSSQRGRPGRILDRQSPPVISSRADNDRRSPRVSH